MNLIAVRTQFETALVQKRGLIKVPTTNRQPRKNLEAPWLAARKGG